MKLGISAFAWTGRFEPSHLQLVAKVKEMGFHGFEIPMFDPADLPTKDIRRAFAASELECTVCAILPPHLNPIDPEDSARKRAVQHLLRCIEAASEMGAKLLGGPLYAPIGYLPDHRPTEDEWSWAVETFQSLGTILDAFNVSLAIEPVNRSETFFIRTAREAKSFCKAVGHPRIGVTMDTFHANIEERKITSAIEFLGPYLCHVHASENHRGVLGEGHIDFRAILATLQRINYKGYLMIEGFGYSPEEEGPGVLWADKGISPEQLACRSGEYLRALGI